VHVSVQLLANEEPQCRVKGQRYMVVYVHVFAVTYTGYACAGGVAELVEAFSNVYDTTTLCEDDYDLSFLGINDDVVNVCYQCGCLGLLMKRLHA